MENKTLSDIKGESTLSAFAKIIDPLCNMAEDPEMQEMVQMENKPPQRSKTAYMLQQAYKVLAAHENDFCLIMSLCRGCTPEEYKADLTYAQVLGDFSMLISDPVWKAFFGWAQVYAIQRISAQENTEGWTN